MLVAGNLELLEAGHAGAELLWLLSEDVPSYFFGDQACTYTLRTVPGRSHTVECTPSLLPAAWSACHTIPGDGAIHQFHDPMVLPARAYRFRVTRP